MGGSGWVWVGGGEVVKGGGINMEIATWDDRPRGGGRKSPCLQMTCDRGRRRTKLRWACFYMKVSVQFYFKIFVNC